MTTVKTIALTKQTFVDKVMSLLFNMLSKLVIAFLPRSKYLLISWLQSPSAVLLEPKKINSVTVSIVSPSICHQVMGPDAMILVLWMLSFKPTFSLSSFTFIKRLFSSSSLSAIRLASSAYLRLLIFLLTILIPACAISSPAFHMMYSTYKLNKQGDNVQPWWTPFPIWNQPIVPCLALTVASSPANRFLRRQVRWSGSLISFRIFQFSVIHTVKGFGVVNDAEEDVSLEFSCFFCDPTDIGNLISGSSAFLKSNLNIWKFSVHVLLKPRLENVEHYFTNVWVERNCAVVWTFFGIAFLWDWNKNWPFPVLWPLLFPKFAGILGVALSQHHLLGLEKVQLEAGLHLTIFQNDPVRTTKTSPPYEPTEQEVTFMGHLAAGPAPGLTSAPSASCSWTLTPWWSGLHFLFHRPCHMLEQYQAIRGMVLAPRKNIQDTIAKESDFTPDIEQWGIFSFPL